MAQYALITGETEAAQYAAAAADAHDDTDHLPVDKLDEDEWQESLQNCTGVLVLGAVDDTVTDYLETLDTAVAGDAVDHDDVLPFDYESMIADGLYTAAAEAPQRQQAARLGEAVAERDSWAIILHDKPDPDAIASGVAFSYIADHYNVDADIIYAGEINNRENAALKNALEIEMDRYTAEDDPVDDGGYNGIAVLDTPTLSNATPIADMGAVDILIDHHPSWTDQDPDGMSVFDVRTDRGATAGIMADYIHDLDLRPDARTATAILHGIYTDTDDMMPGAGGLTAADATSFARMFPAADDSDLEEILQTPMSEETFSILGRAVTNRSLHGATAISYVEDVEDVVGIPVSASLLKTVEGTDTAITAGVVDEEYIKVSARTTDNTTNIGQELEEAFEDVLADLEDSRWNAGGHGRKAGATLPLDIFGVNTDMYAAGGDAAEEFHDDVEWFLTNRFGTPPTDG